MGTTSSKKFIKNNAGLLTEEAALITSAGAADANAIPALNANGVLDSTIINAKVQSAGSADAGKIPQLDGTGRIDATVMPIGIGADTATITASEALAAGDFVNIWSNAGAFNVRKADATVSGKHAMGFVLSAVAANGAAVVYFEGTNTQVTGQTPGDVFLQTTAGKGGATPAGASGNVVQNIGFAVSATSVNFQANRPIVLA